MKEISNKFIVYFSVIFVALIILCTSLFISYLLPTKIYIHDFENQTAYLMLYNETVLYSFGDMKIESKTIEKDGEKNVLMYKNPGEKGNNYRKTLFLVGDKAIINKTEYNSISSWNIFQPTLYENPLQYILTITSIRQRE